jgi:hypothetical protein
MSAIPKWSTLRQTVLDDARLGTGEAHLESSEVAQWIAETDEHDIAGELSEALSGIEGKDRERLCALLALLCQKGDEIAQCKAVDLLDTLLGALTSHCIRQAQAMVDEVLL